MALGEPVDSAVCTAGEVAPLTPAEIETLAVAEALEAERVVEVERARPADASRMRWSITLPASRRSSSFRPL